MPTPDRFFMLELKGDDGDAADDRSASSRICIAPMPDLARHTIMAARSEPPAELEEMAYRWRSARLADLGYVDFYEALDLFRPLDADKVQIGEGSQDTHRRRGRRRACRS